MDPDDQYYTRGGKILKAKMERIYYMLIKEQIAMRKEKTFSMHSQGDQTHVLEGSLWFEAPAMGEVDDYRTIDRTLLLFSVEFDDVVLKCKAQDVQRLSPLQYEILLALNTCGDRYKVFQDTSWMQEAVDMNVGSIVYVMKMPGLPERVPAKVQYRGCLKNKHGLWYGVQLSQEYSGKGTCNGNYLGDTLFSCPVDSGFFVAINKLRISHNPHIYHEEDSGEEERPVSPMEMEYYNDPIMPEQLPPNLEIGERVVWISDEGDEHGMVKWIGVLPGTSGKQREWTVGVEFDNPVGTGTGKYNNRQLFRAKQHHASLIPLLGLMKEEAFYSTIPPPPPLEHNILGSVDVDDVDEEVVAEPPPPPTPPPDDTSSRHQAHTFSFKPRSSRTASAKYSDNSTEKLDSSSVAGDNKTSSSDELDGLKKDGGYTSSEGIALSSTNDSLSTGTTRTKEEILESLRYGGSVGKASSQSRSSRTTTPSTPDSHKSYSSTTVRVYRSPAGPKPPEKQQPVTEEKSIYDRDPDHPYENVERPPDDYDDADFPLGPPHELKHHPARAFAMEEDMYEPLESRKRETKTAACREVDYAPLDKYRAERQNIRMHYPNVNPADPNTSNQGSPKHSPDDSHGKTSSSSTTTSSPSPIFPPSSSQSGYPVPPYLPPSDLPTPTHSVHSSSSTVPTTTWDNSNYGGTVKTLTGSVAGFSESTFQMSEMNDSHSSSPTENSFVTTRTHLTNSTLTSPAEPHHYLNLVGVQRQSVTQPLDTQRQPSLADSFRSSYASLPPMPSERNSMGASNDSATETSATTVRKPTEHVQQKHEISGSLWKPEPLDSSEIEGELDIGSMVEVDGNPPDCRYGVIKWIGYLRDKHKPIAGLEMEMESNSCTGGSFAGTQLFDCPPKKGFFIYMHKLKRDSRFEEAAKFAERSDSLTFGSLECPDIEELCDVADSVVDVDKLVGKQKGIQGHHNSCYLDATLFSMFAFSMAFDSILFRPKEKDDIKAYTEVQKVLREGIVNPLRKNFFVRADKVLKLRKLLDDLSSIKGLVTEEKDPEEFLLCVLQQLLRAAPLLRLSSGQEAFLYQLFIEQDERVLPHPTTQQLLGLSFLQADIKLTEIPSCLILQMPRFGKDFKMYRRIVPSLTIDITGILEHGPRECAICGKFAMYECKDCLWQFGDGSDLEQCSFCEECNINSHRHPKRARHRPRRLQLSDEYKQYMSQQRGGATSEYPPPHKQLMELFAVICIETSHYVAFVKCGTGPNAPWIFFDSMADRMGEQNGYNVPEVKPCGPYIPDWLKPENQHKINDIKDDKQLPDMLRRVLCDGYICMYQSTTMTMYK